MNPAYKKQVFDLYRYLKENGELTTNLSNPTPAKIKQECVLIFQSRYRSKTDRRTLRDFFGEVRDDIEFGALIKNIDTDRFKPLNSFLKTKTSNPDSKNIELLAWLINFETRPFKFENYEEPKMLQEQLPDPDDTTEEPAPKPDTKPAKFEKKWFSKNIKKAAYGFAAAASVFLGEYVYRNITYRPPNQCMYWTGDHYEQIDCKTKGDTLVSPINAEKLSSLKKITKPDTLTKNALGKVWYLKTNNEVEYFTSAGNHPKYIDRKLRPVTLYIIEKYAKANNN